jgi:hypothetical protein
LVQENRIPQQQHQHQQQKKKNVSGATVCHNSLLLMGVWMPRVVWKLFIFQTCGQ